jgi:hypothetical protein
MVRHIARGLLLVGLVVPRVWGQAPVTVRGVAFDSVRGAPLRGALVMVLGTTATATADDQGRFRLDSVPLGLRTFVVQHAALDSIGFPGLSRQHRITSASVDVEIAVPSFQTLWRAACGGQPPSDSGFVYGTIRSATDRSPVADAEVEVSWIITAYDKMRGVRQRRVFGQALTDTTGHYAVCGVPASHWVRVAAVAPGARGGIDLPPRELRVLRRDLLIGSDTATRGTITGLLVDQEGVAFSEARIVLDDGVEVRSGGDGRFRFDSVTPGTRQVEVMSIGMVPIVLTVDVLPRDSASISLVLRRVTTLDVVRVTASRRGRMLAEGLEDRRRRSIGYSMDMTELQAHASFATVLNDFPAMRVTRRGPDFVVTVPDGRGGLCTPEIWVDGARMATAALYLIRPRDVMAVEYFPRAGMIPLEFRRGQQFTDCGAVLVWTNWAFSR